MKSQIKFKSLPVYTKLNNCIKGFKYGNIQKHLKYFARKFRNINLQESLENLMTFENEILATCTTLESDVIEPP